MRLPDEGVPRLIPEFEFPPEIAVPPPILELANTLNDQALFQRSYLWSNAINVWGLQALPEFASQLSAGFVYVNPEVLSEYPEWRERAYESFLFGASVLVDEPQEYPIQRIEPLDVAGRRFPMVITKGAVDESGTPTHPQNGTATCWVKSKSPNANWNYGILTCRHVYSTTAIGSQVNLLPNPFYAAPTSGYLVKKDRCTIDAAIIKIDQSDWPNGLKPLPILQPTVPGQNTFSFDGRMSSSQGKVLRVFTDPRYFGSLFGQRIITDFYGVKGDSGALLFEMASGAGSGIKIGSIPDGAGGHEGIFQDLNQAACYFKVDLFL